jgi:hypothetical protein
MPLDIEVLRSAAVEVKDQLPILETAQVLEFRGGIPTMTADGHHILGPAPGVEGFYFASGCNVAGLSISPTVGEALATWIVDGKTRRPAAATPNRAPPVPSRIPNFVQRDGRSALSDGNAEVMPSVCYRHLFQSAYWRLSWLPNAPRLSVLGGLRAVQRYFDLSRPTFIRINIGLDRH